MSSLVFVVDPDIPTQQLLTQNLRSAGYGVSCCLDAESALLRIEESLRDEWEDRPLQDKTLRGQGADAALPDMLLLEWDLGGQSGEALVRRLRARPRTRELPVIMVTARSAEADKILALESGADDYLTKPFSPRELLARMHAVLRRRGPQLSSAAIQLAGLRLDPATQRVSAGARQIVLGPVEFRLLNFLMHHPGRVHTRSQLLDGVWGRHAVLDERTVDAHVGRLRHALQASGHQEHIETVRGTGYRFVAWNTRARLGWASAA